MAKDIFFSYGHDEYKEFVLKVKDYLEKEGFDVFVDNDKLHEGKDWEHTLEKGIYEYEKVVFFITPYSARRPDGYCLNELAFALYLQKDIIPVMLEHHTPPLSIIRLQFLDAQPFRKNKIEDFAQKLIQILKREKELDHEGIYFDIQQKLQPLDFTQDFKIHKKIIGRKWIIDKIDKWLEIKPDSKIFWITAEAGYGKSAIATYLARNYEKIDAVHFCNHNMPSKNNPTNVIKTLAYSFLTQIDGYYEQIKHIDKLEQKNHYELFESLILNPLEKLSKPNKIYMFVIDGLDEAIYEKDNRLASLISEEFDKLPSYVKVIITSRPDPKLKQELSQFEPYMLDVSSEQNKRDVKEYIDYILKKNRFKDHIFDEEWKNALIQKSESNMLYLNRFFEDVKSIEDISSPDCFPNSLNGIYKRYFKRVVGNTDIYREKYASIFEVMLAYGQAIPMETLAEILEIDEIDLHYKLTAFGTLLTFEYDVVDFFHKSLKDWLISKQNSSYMVSQKRGKRKIYNFAKKFNIDTLPDELIHAFALASKEINNHETKKYDLALFKYIINKKYTENFSGLFQNDVRLKSLYILSNQERMSKLIVYLIQKVCNKISIYTLSSTNKKFMYHYFGVLIPIVQINNDKLLLKVFRIYRSFYGIIMHAITIIGEISTTYHATIISQQFLDRVENLLDMEQSITDQEKLFTEKLRGYFLLNLYDGYQALYFAEQLYNIYKKKYGKNHKKTIDMLKSIEKIKLDIETNDGLYSHWNLS
jgi:hypothetical protein